MYDEYLIEGKNLGLCYISIHFNYLTLREPRKVLSSLLLNTKKMNQQQQPQSFQPQNQQQQHLLQLQQQPLQATEVENHDTLLQLVDDLLLVILENKKLKDEIWRDIDSISNNIASHPEASEMDNPGAFKYQNELNKIRYSSKSPLLDLKMSNNSNNNGNPTRSLFSEIKSKVTSASSPPGDVDTDNENESKQQVILQLEKENSGLMKILKDKKAYNKELVRTLGNYEDSLKAITEGIATKHIKVNREQLDKQEDYKNNLLDQENEMYSKYNELVELEKHSMILYQQLGPIFDVANKFDVEKQETR